MFGPRLALGGVLVVPLAIQLALALWARWLQRTRGTPRWAFVVALVMVGTATTATVLADRGLYRAFDAIETADASQKATLLAQGISEAMNGTAFALVLSLLNAAWLLGWSLRHPRSGAPPGGQT